MEKRDWIVAICNSASDGIDILKFRGSKQEMKEKLLSLIKEDKDNEDFNIWEYGTESIDEIRDYDVELYGYGCYCDYHTDYTAREFNDIPTILNR